MSVTMEYRSGVLSRVDAMVATVKKVSVGDDVETVTFETIDGTEVSIYGGAGFVAQIATITEAVADAAAVTA